MGRWLFFGLVILFAGCSGIKDISRLKKDNIIFSLDKGPCYGKCSVYHLDVYKNRYVVYEGKVNVEKYGQYYLRLSKNDYQNMVNAYDQSDFFGFKDEYPIAGSDLPVITLAYKTKKASKSIKGSIDRPSKLLELQILLEKIVKMEGWKLVKAYEPETTKEEASENKNDSSDIIDNQIIIEPQSNVFLAQWLKKYPQYDIQLVKKISPDLNYWLITYNKQKVSPAMIMEVLKKDGELKFVEFNKRVSPREH